MQRHFKGLTPFTGALLLSTAYCGVAAAEEAQKPSDAGFAEIIVTAQKRAESLQSVPVSVQAITTEKLEELHVESFVDYAKFLPNVSFKATYGPGYNRPFIRGVASGENGNHSGSLPSVGTYLDEQPITTITGALDLHVYDVARVEVLSGPQGTLYGASSQAGTIRIITNKPDTAKFEAGWDAEANKVEAGQAGGLLEGFVNIPVNDKVAVRVVAWGEKGAGYIDNVKGSRTYPTSGITDVNTAYVSDDYNDSRTVGGRAAIKIDLNENWTVTPSVIAQRQETHGIFAFDPSVGDLQVSHFLPESNKDRWVQGALTVEGKVGSVDVVYAGAYLDRDVRGRQDYTDYAYFYDVLDGYGQYFTDSAGNPINPKQWVWDEHDYTKETHELRFSTPSEKRLRAIGGLYYQRQTDFIFQRYIIDGLGAQLSVPTLPNTVWLTSQNRIDTDSALFGEVTYDLTQKLSATAGLRLFKARTSLEGFFGYGAGFAFASSQGEATCFAPASTPFAPCTDLRKSTEEDGETHRLNVEYHMTPDKMVYATYSTGFRPGGINRRGDPFDADYLSNYEVGWKTTWSDKLRLNGAVFLQDWKDFQFNFLATNGLTVIQNAGNAEIYGIEADGSFLATDHLTLNGAISLLHGETSKDSGFAPKGTRMPVAPDVKANLTARYESTFEDWTWFVQGAAVYQGSSTNDLRPYESSLIGKLDAFGTLDFSAGMERNGFHFSAFLTNAFDERGIVARYAECATNVCGGDGGAVKGSFYDVPTQPRTFGIRIGKSY